MKSDMFIKRTDPETWVIVKRDERGRARKLSQHDSEKKATEAMRKHVLRGLVKDLLGGGR